LDPFLYLFDDYIWYLRTVNKVFKSSEWLLIRGGKQWEEEEEEGGAICRLGRMLLAVGI